MGNLSSKMELQRVVGNWGGAVLRLQRVLWYRGGFVGLQRIVGCWGRATMQVQRIVG